MLEIVANKIPGKNLAMMFFIQYRGSSKKTSTLNIPTIYVKTQEIQSKPQNLNPSVVGSSKLEECIEPSHLLLQM